MRSYLARINWTNLMKDKTETKCWILLKDDIEGIIETLIPIKKKSRETI